jgi:type I restriction-modification system DNA methylase subunit
MKLSASPDKAAFEAAHQTVCALVEKFQAGTEKYLSPSYQESEARTDFLDPFWIALGWDVRHETQINPYQQEVKIERGVAMAEGKKRADYAFFLAPDFGRVRFYVEAKKPSRNLRNPDDCFQAVRYGWNSNVPLVVLSDFEEVFLMDCRAKPDIASATARVLESWHYTDWLDKDKFARFYFLFARPAIVENSIERKVEELAEIKSASGRQGKLFRGPTSPVDVEFLGQLEEWRTRLAIDFHAARPQLSAAALTETTQRALDRLVFLRFLEDKTIETEERVSKWHGHDAWRHFVAASRELDKSYNGVLWKKHAVLDDPEFQPFGGVKSAWSDIAFEISASQSPYLFNLIPIPILGSIYERFLGNEIEIGALGKVQVAQKPEARKAGGVYYTPDFIVQYIVAQTVGKIIENKTPAEMAELRFADIACGSGSFLLGVYDLLLRRHAEYFAANPKAAKKAGCILRDGAWILSLQQRRAILENNIFGGDIDAQAVEVAKLSLYLKLLEDETAASARQFQLDFDEQILPDLEKNIVCGNALIGFDVLNGSTPVTPEEERKLNPMDWQTTFPQIFRNGGFDAIVGNPPYGMIQDEIVKPYVESKFETVEGRFDNYELFIERAIKLCKAKGYVGYIVPSPLLTNLYTAKLRRYLIEKHSLLEITNFGMDVFEDPTVHTCIFIGRKGKPVDNHFVKIRKKVKSPDELVTEQYDYNILQKDFGANDATSFDIFLDPLTLALLKKLNQETIPLGQLCFIRQCIKTGDDKKYVVKSDSCPGPDWKPTLRGKSIGRYTTLEHDLWLQYGSHLARNWANKSFYEVDKIGVRETGNRIIAALDLQHRYFLSSLYSVYFKNNDEKTDLKYLLGILNSRLSTFVISKIALELTAGAFTKVRTNQLARLPIRPIDFSNTAGKKLHDEIAGKAQSLIAAREELQSAQTETDKNYSERKILSLDRQLDDLVYRLYDLSPAEIALIETS